MPSDLTPPDPFAYDFLPLWKTYKEGLDDRGYFAQSAWFGPWADAKDFMYALLGQSYDSSGWARQIPYQLPGNTNAYAREGIITNMDGVIADPGDLSISKDDYAIVTITFRVPQFAFQRGDNSDNNSLGVTEDELDALLWAEQEIDSFVDVITLPGTNAFWYESGKPVATPMSLFVFVQTMDIYYHQYPFMPANLVRPYLGRLNNATFLGCARGTVMCKRSKTRRLVDAQGRMTQQFGISFHYRDEDWNKEPVIAKKMNGDGFAYTGNWDFVIFEAAPAENPNTDDTGPWRYDYEDFQKLIEFQLP